MWQKAICAFECTAAFLTTFSDASLNTVKQNLLHNGHILDSFNLLGKDSILTFLYSTRRQGITCYRDFRLSVHLGHYLHISSLHLRAECKHLGKFQVREAERQRDEERTVHDAAMNAVATEVMRIKAGQQELAKTHWNLQVSYVNDPKLALYTIACLIWSQVSNISV